MPVELGLVNNAMEEEMRRGAEAENEAFDANAGFVATQGAPNIHAAPVDNTLGRDVQAEQDAEEEEELEQRRAENAEGMEVYKTMTPEEVFTTFDTDGSGYIDFDEYKAMLPKLGIKMTEAKARKYYNLADTDGSGEVDFEEFRVAMYAVDPNTGNTSGFAPNSLLTPLDAFEVISSESTDRAERGIKPPEGPEGHLPLDEINEDDFFFVLEYLGLKVSDAKQDALFRKFDEDGSGTMDYEEFKQCFLSCCNVKKELQDRDLSFPKFATRMELERILEKALNGEEDAEAYRASRRPLRASTRDPLGP